MKPCNILLYAILDPTRSCRRVLSEIAVEAAIGGATMIQYRDKYADTAIFMNNAYRIKRALEPYNIPFLINDRVDLVLDSGADGVHVGPDDMSPADIRLLIGNNAIVGLTIKTHHHASQAPLEIINYACIGSVYDTPSKDNITPIGLEGWREIADILRNRNPQLPIGAIAGIDRRNAGALIANGADGISVISSIFMEDQVRQATVSLKLIIDKQKKEGEGK
ncbi:thiamine phosphate synthase [Candidatus Endowatersipora endosymbiont of Watersipora subatra]|uniref:thiamine phosphate synthase n=1 Tax=Candidatus Endowatersipora endosymbiont of Watersipora subatra TaxID=3077946 RepID=UPI00312CA019